MYCIPVPLQELPVKKRLQYLPSSRPKRTDLYASRFYVLDHRNAYISIKVNKRLYLQQHRHRGRDPQGTTYSKRTADALYYMVPQKTESPTVESLSSMCTPSPNANPNRNPNPIPNTGPLC